MRRFVPVETVRWFSSIKKLGQSAEVDRVCKREIPYLALGIGPVFYYLNLKSSTLMCPQPPLESSTILIRAVLP